LFVNDVHLKGGFILKNAFIVASSNIKQRTATIRSCDFQGIQNGASRPHFLQQWRNKGGQPGYWPRAQTKKTQQIPYKGAQKNSLKG